MDENYQSNSAQNTKYCIVFVNCHAKSLIKISEICLLFNSIPSLSIFPNCWNSSYAFKPIFLQILLVNIAFWKSQSNIGHVE